MQDRRFEPNQMQREVRGYCREARRSAKVLVRRQNTDGKNSKRNSVAEEAAQLAATLMHGQTEGEKDDYLANFPWSTQSKPRNRRIACWKTTQFYQRHGEAGLNDDKCLRTVYKKQYMKQQQRAC